MIVHDFPNGRKPHTGKSLVRAVLNGLETTQMVAKCRPQTPQGTQPSQHLHNVHPIQQSPLIHFHTTFISSTLILIPGWAISHCAQTRTQLRGEGVTIA
jgi:hypothetical protein